MNERDRVALVTGAAQGIGLATARRFLDDGFAGVMLLDRNEERLAAVRKVLKTSSKVETIAGDLRDRALPGRTMARVNEIFGRLDVLANAAGSTTAADWPTPLRRILTGCSMSMSRRRCS